jgi:hypothetical protein
VVEGLISDDNQMKNWLMLPLPGKDRPGIVAKISHDLFDIQEFLRKTLIILLEGNITTS